MNAIEFDHRPVAPRRVWLKRLGVLGFYFFLIKGLAWLAAPLIIYWLV